MWQCHPAIRWLCRIFLSPLVVPACVGSDGRSLFFGHPPAALLRDTRFTPRRGTVRAGTFWDSALFADSACSYEAKGRDIRDRARDAERKAERLDICGPMF